MARDGITADDDGGSGFRPSGGIIAGGMGVALLGIFMAQNTEDVPVDFLFWDVTWPVWLLTLGSAVLGAVVWFGAGILRRRSRRKARRAERRD